MIGRTLGHYKVTDKIGVGGMGEVYRAHDERLERDVALKILPVGMLADDRARKRFRNEALALSKLNHPNIATIYDFDCQDGMDFLAMEYVAGKSLAQKLATGSLSEREAIALGGQIAEALEEAHEHNIIHRDLKPGNVVVTPKGRAKVLDFGLAKLLHAADGDLATTESVTEAPAAGTLPYMSPEQVRGELLDKRTDIYGAGAVLYEMVTGRRPFPEIQAARLIDAILHQLPSPPSAHNHSVTPGFEGVILKALDKNPDRRYQSARELRVDLERLGAATDPLILNPPAIASKSGFHFSSLTRRLKISVAISLVLLAVLALSIPRLYDFRSRRVSGNAQAQQPPAGNTAPMPTGGVVVQLGETTEEVQAALGPPKKIVALTKNKQIYVYDRLKITFVDGKVTDLE
jgi:serine/threonine protein kinase